MRGAGVIDAAFIRTALVPLVAHPPAIREDVVRLFGGTTEMRYRPEYDPWGVELEIVLNPQIVSIGQLATMFQAAGHGVGIGDNRPECDGDSGTFDLVGETDFAKWRKGAKL